MPKLTLHQGGKGGKPKAEASPKVVKAGVHAAIDGDTNGTLVAYLTLEVDMPAHATVRALAAPPSRPNFLGEGEAGSSLFVGQRDSDLPFHKEYAPQLQVWKVVFEPGKETSKTVSFKPADAEWLAQALKKAGVETPVGFEKELAVTIRKAGFGAREMLLDFQDIAKDR